MTDNIDRKDYMQWKKGDIAHIPDETDRHFRCKLIAISERN
jgi:hypothetical protein